MTDKGAITLSIEALDKSLRQSCAVNPDGSPYLIEALEALRTFKDEMPRTPEAQAKHLQDAIK